MRLLFYLRVVLLSAVVQKLNLRSDVVSRTISDPQNRHDETSSEDSELISTIILNFELFER